MPRSRPLCTCGCGKVVLPGRRFIVYHHRRGQKNSLESNEKRSVTLKGGNSTSFQKGYTPFNKGIKGFKHGPRSLAIKERISASCKCSPKTKAHIEKMKLLHKGEGNPMWKGGVSMLPYHYTWTNEFKEKIRGTQGRFCHVCWKPESEILFTDAEGKTRRHLDVHHIDGDKQNVNKSNFLVLCHPCHQRVTVNKWHMEVVEP